MSFFGKADVALIIMLQPFLNLIINRPFGEFAVFVGSTGFDAGQNFNSVVNRVNSVNMEFSFFHRTYYIITEHQVFDICPRDNHALGSGKTAVFADVEKAFDFFVYAANRLDLTKLVN